MINTTCTHSKVKITDTRVVNYKGSMRRKRWRTCLLCGYRDTSIEVSTGELESLYGNNYQDHARRLMLICEEITESLDGIYEP